MAPVQRATLRDRMRVQFAEADFEIAFNLVDIAEAESICGNYAQATRILSDADNVLRDIQQLLHRMTIPDRNPFAPLLEELHRAIDLAKLHIASPQ
jgi:hypothetical protein